MMNEYPLPREGYGEWILIGLFAMGLIWLVFCFVVYPFFAKK